MKCVPSTDVIKLLRLFLFRYSDSLVLISLCYLLARWYFWWSCLHQLISSRVKAHLFHKSFQPNGSQLTKLPSQSALTAVRLLMFSICKHAICFSRFFL